MADRLTDAEKAKFQTRLDGLSIVALVSEHDHWLIRSEQLPRDPKTDEEKENQRVIFGKSKMTREALEKLRR